MVRRHRSAPRRRPVLATLGIAFGLPNTTCASGTANNRTGREGAVSPNATAGRHPDTATAPSDAGAGSKVDLAPSSSTGRRH
jgi:hypothetical protein